MLTIINRRRLAPLLAIFVAALVPHASGQTVKLTARFEQGQALRYDISAAIQISSKAATERVTQHALLRLTVAEIAPDGEVTLRGAFESLDVAWTPADGPEQTFGWKEGRALADDAPPLAKAYGALGTTPVEITLSRTGEIKSIDGPEKALEAGEGAKLPHPERALGALAYHALPQTLAPLFTLDPGGKDRKPGDTWTTSTKLPAIGGAWIKVSTERTFKELRGPEAHTGATSVQSWQPPQGKPDPTDPVGAPSDQTGRADERWDTGSGRLISRVQDTELIWKLQLQTAPPIDASRTIKSHIELKRLEPAPKASPPASEKP